MTITVTFAIILLLYWMVYVCFIAFLDMIIHLFVNIASNCMLYSTMEENIEKVIILENQLYCKSKGFTR